MTLFVAAVQPYFLALGAPVTENIAVYAVKLEGDDILVKLS